LICFDHAECRKTLPKDPDELRQFTALLLAEVKSQAVLIGKLRHQLAGQRHHRFGSSSESIEQLQLALETGEIAVAKMTAKLRLPDEEPKDKPKRRPIPDHIPRMEVELTTGDDDCAQCGGGLRRLGEDVTEELEYVPGRFIVNRIVRPRFACSGCEAFIYRRALSNGAALVRACWRMCWSINTLITCRSTAKAASSSAMGSTLTARRWPIGSASPRRYWNRWQMPLAVMFWPGRLSLQMTRQ